MTFDNPSELFFLARICFIRLMFSVMACLVFVASTEHKIGLLPSMAIHIRKHDDCAVDHMVRFTRPSLAVFVYCSWSKTGAREDLGTRLFIYTCMHGWLCAFLVTRCSLLFVAISRMLNTIVEICFLFHSLIFCSLSNNRISADGVCALVGALLMNQSLQKLKLEWVQLLVSYLLRGVRTLRV